jgi:transcriptional regulator with XRE-family HTH domain
MANEKLRAALRQAGVQPDELADIIEADPRSVRRWLNGNTTPYPRLRTRIARALDASEESLWPHLRSAPALSSQPSDLVAGYPSAEDVDAPNWRLLMRDAVQRIDLYGETLAPIVQTPGVPELLADKGAQGCPTRILISHTGQYLVPLLDRPGIEIRVLEIPRATHTAYRFDDALLLITPLRQDDHLEPPLFHLRRAAPGGLFDRYAHDFAHQWDHTSQPLDPDIDIDIDAPADEDVDADHPEASATAARQAERVDTAPAPAQRRWPGRRD